MYHINIGTRMFLQNVNNVYSRHDQVFDDDDDDNWSEKTDVRKVKFRNKLCDNNDKIP